jgi:microcin C transport system substrate-binding protein
MFNWNAATTLGAATVRVRDAAVRERGLVTVLGAGLLIAACLVPYGARAQDVIVSHGISTFGELKYPADFAHLDYVNPDAPKGGDFSQWGFGTFDSMNPYSVQGVPASLSTILYESVLTGTLDEIGSSYCLLCETMEYPQDRSWVIFNLRKDVTFSDGSPMTGEDLVFSYNLFLTKGIAEFRSVFNEKVQGVELLDPYKVKFTFSPGIPTRDLPATVGGMLVFSKADYDANGRDLEKSSLEPFLGTGQYVLDSMKPGEQIIYRRNPDYWGNAHPFSIGVGNFDTLRVEYFGDTTAAFEAFKSGIYTFRNENSSKEWATGYDFANLTNGWVKKEEISNGNIASGQAFLFNLRREKFQDVRVREAIGLMFNFEWSNETLFYGLYARINSIWDNSPMAAVGLASPAETAILQPLIDAGLLDTSILTDGAVMAPESSAGTQLDRGNLRKASALLDAAGWAVGADGLRRNAKGELLNVEFVEDSPSFERVINPYVENLKALGIVAKLTLIDAAQMSQRSDPPNFDFDILVGSAVNSYEPGGEMQQAYSSVTKDNSTRNRAGVADPAVDKLIDGILAANTREDLDVATRALDRVLRTIRFWVPQWYKNVYTVAYYDTFGRPETPPAYALGEMSLWWYDVDKAEKLKAAGILK